MPEDGGWFGAWETDRDGLPCFDLDPSLLSPLSSHLQAAGSAVPEARHLTSSPDRSRALVLPAGGPTSCWHQLGNLGLAATAHGGGWTSIYATSRGMVRMTGERSWWGIAGDPAHPRQVRFGMGYAEWTAVTGGFTVTRRIGAPVSPSPVLRVDVRLSWRGAREGESERRPGPFQGSVTYVESWTVEPFALIIGSLMSRYRKPPAGYGFQDAAAWRVMYRLSSAVRAATDTARRLLARTLRTNTTVLHAQRALVHVPNRSIPEETPRAPGWFDLGLPRLFVASLDPELPWRPAGCALQVDLPASNPQGVDPAGTTEGSSRPATTRERDTTLAFAVGLADQPGDVAALIEEARRQSPSGNARTWGDLVDIDLPGQRVTAREARWHATYLVGCQQPDALFGHRYPAQGSAYGFIHGLQGAPRDYAISSVPLAILDPAGARHLLHVIMRMTTVGGRIHYAHTGRGRCTDGGIHSAPTDLPIFFLWALSEYVFATGDRAFLDEPIPYYPPAAQRWATPLERVLQAFRYLTERVGVGPNGLLRVGSGDWADPISAMVPDRRAFHERGESGFNTAFAAYVLPRAAVLVESTSPEVAKSMRKVAEQLRTSMETTFTGRWFLRGYDGAGGEIGRDHLFVDGQVWALIAKVGTDEQRAELVHNIWDLCDGPSPVGATILDRPHRVRFGMLAPGWDCNGGVWAAINALLAWGYALHEPDLAWRSLHKQSLAAHAAAYPNVWYGIWSGPDAYNAHFGEQAGETFIQPATPMQEYPVMNSNAHAGPLLGLLRVLGIEAEPTGLVLKRRGSEAVPFRWSSQLGTFSVPG